MGYVDGSLVCPPAHTIVDHGGVAVPQPNPAYQHWIQQDQAVLSAFVSSMTEGVVGMVMFASTSREAWETLAGAFAATSFARSSGLRQQMAELKKRDMTVNVYFHKMKGLADELTSIGQPLRDDELISYILAGLPKEFDALYEVVNNRTTPMQIRDLYSQLQATEHRHNSRRSEDLHYPAAHYSSPGPQYGAAAHAATFREGGGFRPPFRPDARPPPQPYQPKVIAPAPPGAKPTTGGRTPVVCQLCGIPRHVSSKCFKRFNRDFLGLGNDGSNTEKQIAMAANSVVAFSAHGGQQGYVDPAWYADSGATHHVTHELDKLTTKEPYHGTEHVQTANGAGMRIHNIGHAILPTPSSRSLALKHILHVPQARHNLLSMSKLSNDNNAFI
jgi:histone deacetylase 1/2